MDYFDKKVVSLSFVDGPKALGKGECHTHALGKLEPDLMCLLHSLTNK